MCVIKLKTCFVSSFFCRCHSLCFGRSSSVFFGRCVLFLVQYVSFLLLVSLIALYVAADVIEIELDKNRTWCPRAGCETVCLVEPKTKDKGIAGQSGSLMSLSPVAVKCPTCVEEFCSSCKKAVSESNIAIYKSM